jgi:hypothetical protein
MIILNMKSDQKPVIITWLESGRKKPPPLSYNYASVAKLSHGYFSCRLTNRKKIFAEDCPHTFKNEFATLDFLFEEATKNALPEQFFLYEGSHKVACITLEVSDDKN